MYSINWIIILKNHVSNISIPQNSLAPEKSSSTNYILFHRFHTNRSEQCGLFCCIKKPRGRDTFPTTILIGENDNNNETVEQKTAVRTGDHPAATTKKNHATRGKAT